MLVQRFNCDNLRSRYSLRRAAHPFVKIENFVDPRSRERSPLPIPPSRPPRRRAGSFKSVNERKKVQITDARLFPEPVARLNAALASPQFLSDLSYITGIPALLADPELVGGGIHVTGPGGRLDVHVDFNYIESRKLHRRLNLLLYLNPVWDEQWGGHIQLWNKDVTACEAGVCARSSTAA